MIIINKYKRDLAAQRQKSGFWIAKDNYKEMKVQLKVILFSIVCTFKLNNNAWGYIVLCCDFCSRCFYFQKLFSKIRALFSEHFS